MIDCRHLLHSPSKGSAAKSIQRMVDSGFRSWKLRTCMYPVPATLLSLHMYPPCANKPGPAAMCSCLPSPFWRKQLEIEKRALLPTCSGNGNGGATNTKPTGNGIEGVLCPHVPEGAKI